MRISVLIPTRERLQYLRHAVESVRRQPFEDWEIVVADNASQEDIGGYVASLGEPRVMYRRSDEPIPVTDNWNAALEASTGDYVLMLGDDDAVAPGYFDAIREHAAGPGEPPDLIYSGAHLFAYPGVFPEHPGGYLQPYGYAEFLQGGSGPRDVPHDLAVDLVRDAMRFRLRFGFNMQFGTLRRELIDRLRADGGPLFRSPFPDYYAMCAAFLRARRIVADPRPLVAIGVTPKSYGFYHANRREDEGIAFLDPSMSRAVPERLVPHVMPGSNMNTGWLLAMDRLREDYGEEFGLRIDLRRYRFTQAMATYRDRVMTGAASREDVRTMARHLRPAERALYGGAAMGMRVLRHVPLRYRTGLLAPILRRVGQLPEWEPERVEGRYPDILAAVEGAAGA